VKQSLEDKKTIKKQNWYFTFGSGQAHDGCYITFYGSQEETREKMFNAFGKKWSMQYSEEQWNNPSEHSKQFNGFELNAKVTMADVWGWKQIH